MNGDLFNSTTLAAIEPLRESGFALHWLHPRQKRPIGDAWQDKPVASLNDLRKSHSRGYNLGVRLGEPSLLDTGDYLHVFDVDIRIADLAEEAWDALRAVLPGVRLTSLPSVASGSGGESRHLYFITDKPFRKRTIARSEGKHRSPDGKWKRDWEIDIFGTGTQVVLPPSIHPDTGKPYVWERPFDLDALSLGAGPFIASAAVSKFAVLDETTFEFETREPLDFKPGQMDADLAIIDVSALDYDDWVRMGQALHHQLGGSEEGFDLWLTHTKRSVKFDGDIRMMRRKYRSFGKYRGKPVTMASIRSWALDARAAHLVDEFDDLPDDDGDFQEDDFDALLAEKPPEKAESQATIDWVSLLDVLEDGKGFRPTLHNIELIVKHDERLVGLPQLNEFTQETVQRTPPGFKKKKRAKQMKATRQLDGRVWEVRDTLNGEIWSSARDYAIRSILEAPRTQGGYGMKISDRDLKAATVLAAWDNHFHPVREYLNRVTWDGTPRVEQLFVRYLAAQNNAYTRAVGRLLMVGAVTRIFEPGHKFDFAVIMEGLQGRGKSTFIRTLGKAWFAELEGDFHDGKEMVEKMQGAWIMEIPELSGFGRADVRSIKAFISRQTDKVRLAYEARASDFPRQCVFIGSTNDKEYLKDDTGGRRFWPMECFVDSIDVNDLSKNVDQLWAEAVVLYRAMRDTQPHGELPLYLMDTEASTEAARLQESRRVESADDGMAGQIQDWLDRPMASGSIDEDLDGDGLPRYRMETCLLQVWCECLGNDRKSYNQVNAQMIGRAMRLIPNWSLSSHKIRFAGYGQQRFYAKFGDDSFRARHTQKLG